MPKKLFPPSAFIGFDHLVKDLEHISEHATDHYPPINVIQEDESLFIIEVAVAGFVIDDLTMNIVDNVLTIKGDREQRREQNKYIHKGISARKFTKSFRLSDYAIVGGADLRNGLLTVNISISKPKKVIPITVPITSE